MILMRESRSQRLEYASPRPSVHRPLSDDAKVYLGFVVGVGISVVTYCIVMLATSSDEWFVIVFPLLLFCAKMIAWLMSRQSKNRRPFFDGLLASTSVGLVIFVLANFGGLHV